MTDVMTVPRLPLNKREMLPSDPMPVMPPRPGTPGSVRLTSSVTLTSRLPHDLSRLSATSLITLQLAERVPLRTFYDGLFRFPCHYGIQLYKQAAKVFDRLHTEYVPGSKCNLIVEDIKFGRNEEKKLAFDLAYAAMKYEEVLRQTLDDVGFSVKFPEFQKELSLAAVILYDYQDRRFQRRRPLGSDALAPQPLRQLEEALFQLRTRLSAALARIRILHDAPTLTTLLPATVQPREPDKHRPLYCWINSNKVGFDEALNSLWTTLKTLQPALTESTFRRDEDFRDLLIFEPGWKETLQKTAAFKHKWIIIQEKACCLPAYAAAQELRRLWQREPELRGNLLQSGAGSGRTLAHILSCLPADDAGRIGRVLALAGDRRAVVERQLDDLGVTSSSSRTLAGSLQAGARNCDLKDVVAAIVTPETTHTALADPVEWVIEEGGDIALLRELSMEPTKSALPQRVSALVTDQNEALLRALRLPSMRVVVYATHSENRAENEEVVFGVVDEVNEEQRQLWLAQRDISKLELETPPEKLYELRQLVSAPEDEQVNIPFLVLPQTSTSSGVFIAVIVKNMDFVRRENRLVIEDAYDMGMLDSVGSKVTRKQKRQLQSTEAQARASRRRLRRPNAAGRRSERLLGAGRRPGAEPPPTTTKSLPVAAADSGELPRLHLQVPHLHDCTCVACQQRRRRRRRQPHHSCTISRESREATVLCGGGAGGGGGRFASRQAMLPRRSEFQSLGSSTAETAASSLTSLPSDNSRQFTLNVVRLQAPETAATAGRNAPVLSPIPGSGSPRGRQPSPLSQLPSDEASLERLAVAADTSRAALRAVQQQMENAIRSGSRPVGRAAADTVLELQRARLGAQAAAQMWWAQAAAAARPAFPPLLRPHVRQLIATRGRSPWRWTAPDERPRPPPLPAVCTTGPRRHTSRSPDSVTAAARGRQGRGELLPRLPLRPKHLSMGQALSMHKVNIGDMLPNSRHAPAVF